MPGWPSSSRSAANAAPITGGGSAVEKMNGRATLVSSSTMSGLVHTYAP